MERSFALASGQTLNPALGFVAHAVQVDNPGGQWVYSPDARQWVEPYVQGAVIPLPGLQAPILTTIPPPGQVNTGSGQAAVARFTSQALPPSAGTAYGPNLSAAAGQLLPIPAAATNGSVGGGAISSLAIPAGSWLVMSLLVSAVSSAANATAWFAQLTIGAAGPGFTTIGWQTGYSGYGLSNPFPVPACGIPFSSDGTVTINCTFTYSTAPIGTQFQVMTGTVLPRVL